MANNDNAQIVPSTDAALQQQQTAAQAQSSLQSVAQPSVGGDSLTCQWQNCGERCPTAEQLYDHICERHVGRKSTNNLNLTCQWGNCRTTTVKRDHITSHIRVHVPLKPHKCDFCGKAFKRPQDLKKHVKTHADDSVLMRSPEPNRAAHGAGGPSYQGQSNKLVADLQNLAATASGYYPEHHQVAGQPMYYQNSGNNSGAYHGTSAPQQGSAYGPVYYAVTQAPNASSEYELSKQATFDALNEFFGDAKRRKIDPSKYYDVGQRLSSLQTLQLPIPGGYGGGGGGDYHSGGTVVASAQGPLLQPQYSLPLPALRTKNDLLQIDQFLDQLQQTVYENSNQAAAAGVAQPGTHYVPAGVNYRTSHSPQMAAASHPATSHATAVAPLTSSVDTPALTPASSVLSYQSNHSPSSVHSGQTISPVQRSNVNSVYPTLPTVTAMSESSNAYASVSSAPPPGLAGAFDPDGRRRYSAGILQKAPGGDQGDSDGTSSSSPNSRSGSSDAMPKIDKLGVRSPGLRNVDPALRSPGMLSEMSEEIDKTNEAWVENIRIIEALRQFIRERLETGDYVDDGGNSHVMQTDQDKEAQSLYPVLREVQGAA